MIQPLRHLPEVHELYFVSVLRNRMVVGQEVYDAVMYSLIPQDFGLSVDVLP